MERDTTFFRDGESGGEGRAGERLTERSARFVERLMQKLARHSREAEQLAETMQHHRRDA